MLRIKLFAIILVVGLAGVVYAAGNMQTAAHQNHGAQSADKAPACCQKKDAGKDGQTAAMSCDKDGGCCKDGCCHGHKADAKQASAKSEGESCCAGGGCCKGGDASCCKGHKKAGAEAAVVKTSAGAESCCAAGAACCKEAGADCCQAHKAAAQNAGQKHAGCCACCGDSCETHTGR